MEVFFLRQKLVFLLNTLEVYLVNISKSDYRSDFVTISENYIGTIYRAGRDFSESLFVSKISIYTVQNFDGTGGTLRALRELNSLLITWMDFKLQHASNSNFQAISEEQTFINNLISDFNNLTKFRIDYER